MATTKQLTPGGNQTLEQLLATSARNARYILKQRQQLNHAPGALRRAAYWYAKHGLAVFPCTPGEKRPATRNGFKNATTNLHQIKQWWDANENYNIGLPTGRAFDVVDIDIPENEHLVLPFFRGGDIPLPVARVKTPRGIHLYIPPVQSARNGVQVMPGIDYRAAGGYVIAPPSRTAKGEYRWEYYELNAAVNA